jgi:hypothetical protein
MLLGGVSALGSGAGGSSLSLVFIVGCLVGFEQAGKTGSFLFGFFPLALSTN